MMTKAALSPTDRKIFINLIKTDQDRKEKQSILYMENYKSQM
jgi:hypothetical protein